MVLLKRWLLAFGVMLGSSFCVSHGVLALMLRLLLLLALFARGKSTLSSTDYGFLEMTPYLRMSRPTADACHASVHGDSTVDARSASVGWPFKVFTHFLRCGRPSDSGVDACPVSRSGELRTVDASVTWPRWLHGVEI